MDAYVQIALIEKSNRVFAVDADTFLSFPLLSPLTFTSQALAALVTPSSSADYAAAADFSRIVNFLPRDIVASLVGERYLWDVYADILARAEVAGGNAGQRGASGSALLYDVAPDGTRSETAAYRGYRQYRDAWIVAREDYGTHKLTGELTDDADARRLWSEVEEPLLRAALAKAEGDWKTIGRRDEIEAALQVEREAALMDPRQQWREWAASFNPDIDLLNDAGGGRYAPTGLSPKDFTRDTAWLRFDLSAGEIARLVSAAPAALKVILDDDDSAIDHVSFEYRSVAIVRPWFRSNVLTSRIWRSNDPELVLSDGDNPPSGACPAYVTAVVFIRNVQASLRAAPAIVPAATELRFTLPAERLTPRNLQIDSVLLRHVPPPSATPVAPVAVPLAFRRLDMQSLVAAPSIAARTWVLDRRLRARVPPSLILQQPPSAPPPPPPVPDPRDDISILAFICKRLPKAPDAVADLSWN